MNSNVELKWYAEPPAGTVVMQTGIAIARHVLCSHTEVSRMRKSGELTAVGQIRGGILFRSSDLDALRLKNFQRIQEKYRLLRSDEKAFLSATGAELAAFSSGYRDTPNKDDIALGKAAAETQIAAKRRQQPRAGLSTGRRLMGARTKMQVGGSI